MAGQNLADGSTMELVRARQVANRVTSQIGGYQARLLRSIEAMLGLLRGPSWTLAFELFE